MFEKVPSSGLSATFSHALRARAKDHVQTLPHLALLPSAGWEKVPEGRMRAKGLKEFLA